MTLLNVDQYVDDNFEECQTLPLVIESVTDDPSALGVPPYYLMAFELGGVPTTTVVPSTNLSWQVTHKAGELRFLFIWVVL